MNVTLSDNETKNQSIRAFLLPQKVEVLLYLTIAVVLLAIINYRAIMELVLNGSGVVSLDGLVFNDAITVAIYRAYEGLGSLSVLLLWMCIGSVVYAFGWFFRSITLSVRTDIVTTQSFSTTTSQPHSHSTLSKYSALFASLFGILGYVFFLLNSLLPRFSTWTFAWYTNESGSLLLLPLAVICTALGLYVLKLLFRIVRYTIQTISPKY